MPLKCYEGGIYFYTLDSKGGNIEAPLTGTSISYAGDNESTVTIRYQDTQGSIQTFSGVLKTPGSVIGVEVRSTDYTSRLAEDFFSEAISNEVVGTMPVNVKRI